jgi:hypothetical protein
MPTVYVLGRCLTCWTAAFTRLEVGRHLPPVFSGTCESCGRGRQFAITGQVVSTLSPAALRQIKGAQERKVRVEWEQLPLVEALLPTDVPGPMPGNVRQFHKPSQATHDAGPAKGTS